MNQPLYQTAVQPVYQRRAFVQIIMNAGEAKDVTDLLDPHLISVTVTLKRDGVATAAIELDDREASLPIPPDQAGVKILLGWSGQGPLLPLTTHMKSVYGVDVPAEKLNDKIGELPYTASGMQVVFVGTINSVESGFSRNGGGRRLWIDCKGTSDKNDGKSSGLMTVGQGQPNDGDGEQVSISDFFSNAGKAHGFNVITQGVDHIKRDFWAQDHESFRSMGQRLALAHGLNFEIWGRNAYLTGPDVQANGIGGPTIEAKWGVNLISWRIKPFVARPQYKQSTQRFFDIWNGSWKSVVGEIAGSFPFSNNEAIASLPGAAPNFQAGEQANEGVQQSSGKNRGTGWVIVNGEPTINRMSTIAISGARPGVDGSYRVDEAEHSYTRGGGYTTRCKLNKPDLNDDYYKSIMEKISTSDIEKQLAEHPFFAWQDGLPEAYIPQVRPEIVRPADGGVERIDIETGDEAWRPNP